MKIKKYKKPRKMIKGTNIVKPYSKGIFIESCAKFDKKLYIIEVYDYRNSGTYYLGYIHLPLFQILKYNKDTQINEIIKKYFKHIH